MGCCSTSSQGQMYSKRETARYFCCGGNLFLWYADLMFRDKSRFLAFIQSSGALIKSSDLNRSYAFFPNFILPKKAPFPQSHSNPFAVRHYLLCAKESTMNLYEAAYPFLLRLELAAVQIIAVDTVQKSSSCIASYMMKTVHFSKNTISTGDLNRPRSPEVRRPLVYFWFFSYKRKE